MSTILPPSERLWWKEPVERTEIVWIVLALIWCVVLTLMMPYWHVVGRQNLSNETYRTTPEAFAAKAQAVVDEYTVRTATDRQYPVVHPPAGGDVYVLGRLWEWWPILELEKGKTYRLHLSSMDWQHGFSLQPLNVNVQVLPGYELVMTVTPDKAGEYTIVCNEYCGIGHHTMLGKIHVVE
ncbi:MAG: cytochrome C oxidase subunit II [Gammaproteobacteria bacterium]|nr:cytochrome C oxidase subunit II [Gammaproteobacteria bacterium]NIR83824.1 cytochrome C oxidase subunit II [Gammaproteobacteria bacterium]NIV73431.1 cytochrome C oxidase subunit II [Gammaproteobacteria bacterium]